MLKQLHYFEKNAAQMLYAEFRQRKLFVGSGVVEAGCRTVIDERLKHRECAHPCGRQRDHRPQLLMMSARGTILSVCPRESRLETSAVSAR